MKKAQLLEKIDQLEEHIKMLEAELEDYRAEYKVAEIDLN